MTAQPNQSKSLDKIETELRKALVALGWMYNQYCGDNFGHNFMGAGEEAIEILERYGLGNEKDGVDEIALNKLEQGNDLKPSDQEANSGQAKSPTTPDKTQVIEEILEQYKQRIQYESRKADIAYVDENTRKACIRNVKLYTEETTQAIQSLISDITTEAVIKELKQFEPPESYEELAKLAGRKDCPICGFNAVALRKYIAHRIDELKAQPLNKRGANDE